MDWVEIYDLEKDRRHIKAVQDATLSHGTFGLKPDPALFGSADWWAAIQRGELPTHWLQGTIKTPLWTGMNDFPEVEIQEESGVVSRWPRWGDLTQYSKGRRIRIQWVTQQAKESSTLELGIDREVVLRVWLETGDWRRTAKSGPGPDRRLDEGWEGGPA